MTDSPFACGLAVSGPTNSDRQLVRHEPTLNVFADGEGESGEAYLSHFVFGPEMFAHFRANGGSPAGFAGPCAARYVVLDIDRPDLNDALADCRKLVQTIMRRYPEIEDDPPIYFSGNKGFHVLVELAHRPTPAVGFHRVAKTYCEGLAALAEVAIDGGIYDLVRIVRLPNAVVPVRLFVPLDVARARRPAPLVIALHDEGGDENTFPDVFGRIVGLAESSGVIVVSVNSDLFSGSGDDFNGIVAAIQADVTIDVARIYVIGHGRGAGQATTLAATRASLIAGVACIAGFGRVPTGRAVAPMLVILGEIDPISATEQLTPPITEAISGGASLDVRVVPNQGHTLIVNAMLPTVVEWLLRQTRPRAR